MAINWFLFKIYIHKLHAHAYDWLLVSDEWVTLNLYRNCYFSFQNLKRKKCIWMAFVMSKRKEMACLVLFFFFFNDHDNNNYYNVLFRGKLFIVAIAVYIYSLELHKGCCSFFIILQRILDNFTFKFVWHSEFTHSTDSICSRFNARIELWMVFVVDKKKLYYSIILAMLST